jgi:hypothetical protein
MNRHLNLKQIYSFLIILSIKCNCLSSETFTITPSRTSLFGEVENGLSNITIDGSNKISREEANSTSTISIKENLNKNKEPIITSFSTKRFVINEQNHSYALAPFLLVLTLLIFFLFLMANKLCFLALKRVCSCVNNDSICLFLNYSSGKKRKQNEEHQEKNKTFKESENYSVIVRTNKTSLPFDNSIGRNLNKDVSYYGVVNENSDDETMPRIVRNKIKERNGSANISRNVDTKLESFRLGSLSNNYLKESNKIQRQTEYCDDFYLDIYNSFANLNLQLNDKLYVKDDALHELDKIEKTLSKSVCELNELHKNIEEEENERVEQKSEYYYQEIENVVMDENKVENSEELSNSSTNQALEVKKK